MTKSGNDDGKEVFRPLRSMQTGDVLLYRTTDLGATFNAVVQGSLYSHVSLVIKGSKKTLKAFYPNDYKSSCPEIDDSSMTGDGNVNNNDNCDNGNGDDNDNDNGNGNGNDIDIDNDNDNDNNHNEEIAILEVVPKRGVVLFPMEQRLARTIKCIRHLSVRRHEGSISEEHRTKLMAFINQVMGRNLEILTIDLFRALVFNRCRCSQKLIGNSSGESWEEFFCSELVAEGLQQLGIIRDDAEVKSNLVLPSTFADPHDRKNMRHSGAFDFCDDKICNPGHGYTDSELLIKKHNEMYYALKDKKKRMKQQARLERKKSHKSNNQSRPIKRFSMTVSRRQL